jgi:ABC-type multidrug transport system fused ATPase/permease subunit
LLFAGALDAEAEAVVQAALKEKFQDRTVLIIAHRLSTIAAADQIYVMSNGKVLEHGAHDELLSHNGAYSRLVRRQQSSGGRDRAVVDNEFEV